MPALLGIVGAYWKPIGFALLLLGALAYRGMLVHERDSARASAAAAESQLTAERAAEAQCESAVAEQNAAVNALRDESARTQQAAETRQANLATDAATTAAAAQAKALALSHAQVASGCDAAIKWANGEAAELGQW